MRSFRFLSISALLILLWWNNPLAAQATTPIDSLRKVLASTRQDTTQVRTLHRLAAAYRGKNADSLKAISERELALATNIGDLFGQGMSNSALAGHYRLSGEYNKAISYYNTALNGWKQLRRYDKQAIVLSNLGVVYQEMGAQAQALEYMLSSVQLSESKGIETGLAECYNNIGGVYMATQNLQEARTYYLRAVAYHEKRGPSGNPIPALANLALLDYQTGAAESAIGFARKAHALAQANPDPGYLTLTQEALGRALSDTKPDSAIIYLLRVKEAHTTDGTPYRIAIVNNFIADVYFKSGKYSEMIKYANESLKYAIEVEDFATQENIRKLLYQVYKERGDLKSALTQLEAAVEAGKRTAEQLQEDRIVGLRASYELEKKQREIAQLEQERRLQAEKQRQQWWFLGILGIMVLLLAGALVQLFRSNKIQQRINAELAELNAFKTKILSILSHDLRGPFASLAGVLGMVEKGGLSQEQFEKIVARIRSIVSGTTQTLEDLLLWAHAQMEGKQAHPQRIVLSEAVAGTQAFLQGVATAKDIRLENQTDPAHAVLADVDHLRLVLRNLMANAVKFTPAGGQVTVTSRVRGALLAISVTDTGVGMPPEKAATLFTAGKKGSTDGTSGEKGTGLGLVMCKEFVEKTGGTIAVESTPGAGSTFTFTLPVATNGYRAVEEGK